MIKTRRLTSPATPFFQLFPLIRCGNDPCKLTHAQELLVNILRYLWMFSAVVAVLVVLWGAFQFVTAAGDPAKAESARKTIWSGLIGVIIVVVAYAFVRVFARTIFGEEVPPLPGAPP